MIRALISLGTNSTRLLVIRDLPEGPVEQLLHRSVGTRLGEGLRERGALSDEGMRRTLEAVVQFERQARDHRAAVEVIATSAMRRASNAKAFVAQIESLTGASLRILSGDEEAAFSFAGATYGDAPPDGRVAVVDVGGGSTECAVGRARVVERAVSVEIGAVRLAEIYPELMGGAAADRARDVSKSARTDAARSLAPLARFAPVDEARLVGGTATTMAAMDAASSGRPVENHRLNLTSIDRTIDRLLGLNLEQRRAEPGMIRQRADILPAGAIVASEALRRLGVDAARVETDDLLLGYLVQTGAGASPG